MEEKKIDLSIIILAFNSKTDLARLLPGVFNSKTSFNFEVIIVDNGSTDGSTEWLNRWNIERGIWNIRAIKNTNTGFAGGNNLGIKQAQGKYILVLNPDTQLEPNTLKIMLEFMENHQEVGISTCKVLLPNGQLDLACRRRFPNPWNSFKRLMLFSKSDYNFTNFDKNQPLEIDSCMGAFMMIRGELLEKIGLFDETFFMYGEDIDLCWRCKESGFKVWYYPHTSIIHYKGSSSSKASFKALKWFHNAMWIFYKKHYCGQYPFFLNWLVWLGIYFRLILLMLVNFLRKEKFVSKR